MKHMSAMTKSGTTFGMDVDGRQARRVVNKFVLKETNGRRRRYIDYKLIGSLMGEAHWLVTEVKDFDYVWFDGDTADRYFVSYEEANK